MALSSGFAIVGCASEDTINSSLRILQANFVPAYGFSLPSVVTVGSTSVSISGSVIMLAPQVELGTRADNKVTVNVALGGQLTLVAGAQSVQTEIALSTTVLVGLIAKVATVGNNQQITVGIDLSSASVTTVDVAVLLGPPLALIFQQALTSKAVLSALTAALRAVPAGLLQITDANLGLPFVSSQTYPPPGGNPTQTVTIAGSPTGGAFTLTYKGQTTSAIAYNATAATVQAAITALSTVGNSNAVVTGAAGGPWVVAFSTAAFSLLRLGLPIATMTAKSSLAGGTSPTVSVHVPPPETLFALAFTVSRVTVRPLDAATPGPGALAVAVDVTVVGDGSAPVATSGDPNGLVDLNTFSGQAGATVEWTGGGNFDSSSPSISISPPAAIAAGGGSGLAVVVDGEWLADILTTVLSPQLAGKFHPSLAKKQVAFTATPDCVQLSFDPFTLPLNSPWAGYPFATNVPMAGFTVQVKATYFTDITVDEAGYYHGAGGNIGNADVGFTANTIALLQSFNGELTQPPQPASGAPLTDVTFSTTPAGGYFYLDGAPTPMNYGAPIRTGPGLAGGFNLVSGTLHAITANPQTFQSWRTTGNVFFKDSSGNWKAHSSTASSTGLKATGPGTLSLQESSFDPFLTMDYWSAQVVGTDIQLPSWVTFAAVLGEVLGGLFGAVLLGPLFPLGIVAGMFAVSYGLGYIFTTVSNASNQAVGDLQDAINGANIYSPGFLITQVPGTTVPNILTEITNVGLGPDGITTSIDNSLLTPGWFAGNTGSVPYLMVTDQDVSDPSTIPDQPDPYGGFPVRFDGSFNWPGMSWNQPGQGLPTGGTVPWDVHHLNPIGVVLQIPPGLFNPQDPTVLVQWTVTRTDTNALVLSKTGGFGQAGAPVNIFAVSIDHGSASLQSADQFLVTCSLFRPLANGGTEQIFSSGNLYVPIADHFDRNHPYVQWTRPLAHIYPGQPFWNAIPPKAHVPGVHWTKPSTGLNPSTGFNRGKSKIHRTDFWDGGRRCLVADTAGQAGARMRHGVEIAWNAFVRFYPPGWATGYGLDDPPGWCTYFGGKGDPPLPISLSEAQNDRERAHELLCDYCFFGGQTKTQLRSDFP